MVVYLVAGCLLGWMIQLVFDHVFIRRPMKFSATRLRQLRNRLKGYEEETTTLRDHLEAANLALQNTSQESDTLTKQLQQISGNNAKLESSMNQLQIKYASKEVDLMQANEQIGELEQKLKARPMIAADASTEEVLDAYQQEHQLELEARSAELRASNDRVKSLKNELDIAKQELTAYQSNFSTTPEEYDAKIADMRDQLDAKQIALQVANERTEALAASLEAVRQSLKAKEAEIEGTPADAQSAIDALTLEVASQNEELARSSARITELERELTQSKATATTLESELQRRPNISTEHVVELRELLAEREVDLIAAEEQLVALKATQESADNDRQKEDARLQSVRTELGEKEKSLTEAVQQIEQLEQRLRTLQEGQAKANANALNNNNAQHAEGVPPVHSNDTLYYQISSLHADLMGMQREMKSLQQQVAIRDQKIVALSNSKRSRNDNNNHVVTSDNHLELSNKKDDLTAINGIGAVYSAAFYDAGVYSFKQLSQLSDAEIISIIKPKRWQSIDATEWIAQAAKLAVDKGAYQNE